MTDQLMSFSKGSAWLTVQVFPAMSEHVKFMQMWLFKDNVHDTLSSHS